MLLTPSLPFYPSIDSEDFYQQILDKKEFRDYKLTPRDEKEEGIALLPTQILMGRLFSPLTLLNKVLLFHQMGVGKTCSAFAVAEQARKIKVNARRTIVLVSGPMPEKNFERLLISRCTDKYEPVFTDRELASDTLTEEKKTSLGYGRSVRAMKKDFIIKSHVKFAQELLNIPAEEEKKEKEKKKKMDKVKFMIPEDEIINKYSNSVIVIDEIHHIRTDRDIYEIYYEFLHTVRNCKIILMTGTPMRDRATEIVDMMNLLLPRERRVENYSVVTDIVGPIISDVNRVMEEVKINDENNSAFLDLIKGYVSYVRFPQGDTEVREMKNWESLYVTEMKEPQLSVYQYSRREKKKKEEQKKKKGEDISFRLSERYASIFGYVTEDGTNMYGKKLSAKNILSTPTIKGIKGEEPSQLKYSLKTGNDLVGLIEGKTIDEKLISLENYSCKFATVIKEILRPDNVNESAFVFTSFVEDGAVLFSMILEMFGFKRFYGTEDKKSISRAPRYALITGKTRPSDNERVMEFFNDKINFHGEYIRVIIGSIIMSESISLRNVRQFHNLTTFWNNTELDQAIGRTIRLFSHNDLEPQERYVKIYKHCAMVPNNPDESIDYYMYQKSFRKDRQIKHIEYLLKLGAIDCSLTKLRNERPSVYDLKRECEYKPCEYKCYGNPEEKKEDRSTYELYYDEEPVMKKIQDIKKLFINDSVHEFDSNDPITIKALERIVSRDIPIRSGNGFYCFLRKLFGSPVFYLARPEDGKTMFILPKTFVKDIDYNKATDMILRRYSISQIPQSCNDVDFLPHLPLVSRLIFLEELYSQPERGIIKKLIKGCKRLGMFRNKDESFEVIVNGEAVKMINIDGEWKDTRKIETLEQKKQIISQDDNDQKYAGRRDRGVFKILNPKSKRNGEWISGGKKCDPSYSTPELIQIFLYLTNEMGIKYDITDVEIDPTIMNSLNFDPETLKKLDDETKKRVTKFIGNVNVKRAKLCERLERMFDDLREKRKQDE
jgi:superfamily II DNA or RNA helicase